MGGNCTGTACCCYRWNRDSERQWLATSQHMPAYAYPLLPPPALTLFNPLYLVPVPLVIAAPTPLPLCAWCLPPLCPLLFLPHVDLIYLMGLFLALFPLCLLGLLYAFPSCYWLSCACARLPWAGQMDRCPGRPFVGLWVDFGTCLPATYPFSAPALPLTCLFSARPHRFLPTCRFLPSPLPPALTLPASTQGSSALGCLPFTPVSCGVCPHMGADGWVSADRLYTM